MSETHSQHVFDLGRLQHTALPQLLDITAPLVVLEGAASNGASSSSSANEGDYSGIKLCLLDTPGPNEAGEEGLKHQVQTDRWF